jgi:two-component system, chemotaxis family, chemotaxis protein CheY
MAKILIIDDSVVARMSLKRCLPKDQGHEFTEAVDGKTALETFRSVKPNVTFLDLTMPDKSGVEVLFELRREFPKAVIIIISADVQKQTKERVEQLGAFAILKKPPAPEMVQHILARAVAAAEVCHD